MNIRPEVSLPVGYLIGGVVGVEALVGPEEQALEAMYFDTDDLRLAQAGVTLRRRRGGHDAGWHLKLPVGSDTSGDSRDEVRVGDARALRRRTRPVELPALVRAMTRGAQPAPVAELSTTRRRWRLTDNDGQILVEVVDDHVVGHTLGASTSGTSWRVIDREATRELGAELKWLAGVLGGVRDLAIDRLLTDPPLTRRARGKARRELPALVSPSAPTRRRARAVG